MTSLMSIAVMVLASASISEAARTRPAAATRPAGLSNPFFALDTATKDANHQSYESQARMLKELGYAGWGPSAKENVPEMLKALDAQRLKMFAIYVMIKGDVHENLKETMKAWRAYSERLAKEKLPE